MGDYAAYVISAYAIVFGAVAGLVGWAVVGRIAARRDLARAERSAERIGRAR
ncbi:heme exporter protein CcmD [Acuticoccus sp. I52.16.1]|uniref:heme exporter protein CcmD n=1 Tax=Acuticoccus sp. I52.16.1 TaxID=2928472 RepID=UPI001FD0BC52|nr:heme exporter protein CcmD [Acuticoccus sp. I52.16.1]UOM33422.1 heme exporter protein CcmD [Acuticoccus sp. I52.16.1]